MQLVQREELDDVLLAALDADGVRAQQTKQVDHGGRGELADLEELHPCTQQELSHKEQPRLHSKHDRFSSLFCDDRVKGKITKFKSRREGRMGPSCKGARSAFILSHPREKDPCSCRSLLLMKPRAG